MIRITFVLLAIVIKANSSFSQCLNKEELQKAFKVNSKISKKAHKLNEKRFDDYLKNENNYFQKLIAKRNSLIFNSCDEQCNVTIVDSLDIKNSEIEIINQTDKDPMFLFENKVVSPFLFYTNSGFMHNFKFYRLAWENEKRRTLSIWHFNQFKNYKIEDSFNYYEIWVQPNEITNLGITYFIKTEKQTDKLVCIIPALWTEI